MHHSKENTMTYRYGVIGAGRQGVATAYDLFVHGEASHVVLADHDPQVAGEAAAFVARLGPFETSAATLDAGDRSAAARFMADLDVVLGSASWRLNVGLSEAAIAAGTHFVDLGGNADVVWTQLDMDECAREAGIAVVPDCGQVPGTGANLMAYVARSFDTAETVTLYDGGIPVSPEPPWNYQLAFNMDGLTNEYTGDALYIVDGEERPVEVFDPTEYELLEFEEFGTLEAFATAGGLTTLSRTLAGQIGTLKNKTLRYPGHAAQFKAFRDAGFFTETPVEVDGHLVTPRSVFHAMIEPRIRAPEEFEDIVVNRVVGQGLIAGERCSITLDVINRRPEGLPFTAMQAATGWHAAIIMHRLATGRCDPGVHEVENAIAGADLLDELRLRGFTVSESRVESNN
jgi:lysine 6-dehydrogenase